MRRFAAAFTLAACAAVSACASSSEPAPPAPIHVCGPWRPIGAAHWTADPAAVVVPPLPGARC